MKTFIKYSLVLCGLTLAMLALSEHLSKVPALIGSVHFGLLGGAFLGLLGYQIWNAGVWSEVLKAMGVDCKRLDCTRIWLESESLKWIPGTVWSYGSRVVTAKKLGVSKQKASSSIVLELMLTNVAWAIMASLIVFSSETMSLLSSLGEQAWTYLTERAWLLATMALGAVAASVLVGFYASKSPRVRSLLQLREIDLKRCAAVVVHYLLLCVFNASMMWLVLRAIPSIEISLLSVMGLAGVAWLAGFWAIGVPGGVGVREAVIVLIVSQFGPVDSAVLAAVLWRGLQMAAEITALLASVTYGASMFMKKSIGKKGELCVQENHSVCPVAHR
ncbi:flippase-like domain-containing protein [Verrucomicrobiaceae bacterium R5-34]|nr:flippase-like domain-containing protein [Verrucomicrobiaceae bacterium R5-34]